MSITVDEDIHEVHAPKSKGTLLLTPSVDEDIHEVHGPKADRNSLYHNLNSDKHEDHEPVKPALEQEVQSGTKNNNFVKAYANVLSPWPSHVDLPSSRSLALARSRSCRASLMTSPLWFHEFEQSCNTPSDGFLKDLPAMPEGVRNRRFSVICDVDTKPFSGVGYQSPEKNTHNNLLEGHNCKTSSEDGISRHSSFVDGLKEMDRIQSQIVNSHSSSVDGLKEMDQIQHQKQQTDNQEMEVKVSEGCGVERNMTDVSMDPMQHPPESPSRWLFEFEKKQKEIFELWHACHVSLVHRSCFFLLFKGDPLDSIYMEVEYRRLSFLRISSSVGNLDKLALGDGSNPILASSMKTLRREREMRKQMLKRLSAQERESLYTIWGIALDSKQRRQQLARRIWTETNIEHVRDSASVVAKLIGLLEPGLDLKEMFGLNFTPELTNFKSYSRHQRASSLL